MKKINLCILTILFLLVFSLSAFADTFRFTAIPDENTARLQERFDKIANYLSEELGVDVEFIPVKSYSASIAALKNNQVQLAWFGGLSGVKARRAVNGAIAIAQGEEDTQFINYFIAHTSTGINLSKKFPADIRGRTFTFGSKGSTSGRLMPEYFIRQNLNAAPHKVFKRVGYSGNHSKTIALVQSGSYEVGAVNPKVWENEMKAGNIDPEKVRIIWESPSYPNYNWTIRGDAEKKFGKGFIKKVQDAFINMNNRDLLDSFPRKRFIPADNSMYKPILDTAIAVGIIDG